MQASLVLCSFLNCKRQTDAGKSDLAQEPELTCKAELETGSRQQSLVFACMLHTNEDLIKGYHCQAAKLGYQRGGQFCQEVAFSMLKSRVFGHDHDWRIPVWTADCPPAMMSGHVNDQGRSAYLQGTQHPVISRHCHVYRRSRLVCHTR